MNKWSDIAEQLKEELPDSLVEPRDPSKGIYGEWMKGSVAMGQANKIFGPDGWSTRIIVPPAIEDVKVDLNLETGEFRPGGP